MLLSLDESAAAPIVAELDPIELRKLREVAAMMRAVPTTALESVYSEFVARSNELVAVPHHGVSHLRRLAAAALGDASEGETAGVDSALARIGLAPSESIAAVVEQEHPQIVAAILSQMDAPRAARVLQLLPNDTKLSVLLRLSTMTEIPAGLLETVAVAFAKDLPEPETEASISVDGLSSAASLIRRMGKEHAGEILEQITEENVTLAAEIRQAMFSFEDLRHVDNRSLRSVMTEVTSDVLVVALKTASEATRKHITSCMSKRAATLLADDLEVMGAVRLADVEAAQREIVNTALRLEAGGTITLWEESEDVV
jgi:flagellar motor switch protein FliG